MTRHTCTPDGRALPFGRRAPAGECPRCDELAAGAPPRRPPWVEALDQRRRDDEQRSRAMAAHFAPGGPHQTGACDPVCTAFDW